MKKVLVTGGAGGIGKEIAATYWKQGDLVVFTDVDQKAACWAAGKERLHFVRLDASNLTDVEKFMAEATAQYGLFDIIIHNVGISKFKPLLALTTEEFLEIQKVNYISGYVLTREWVRLRQAQQKQSAYGRVVFIASTRHLQSEPDSEAYAASKGAVVSLTHALAASTSDHAVTVNAISPGWIENGDYSALRPEDHAQHWSGRVGKAADIAAACLFLTDEKNDFINGQNIYVDGGMTKTMLYQP